MSANSSTRSRGQKALDGPAKATTVDSRGTATVEHARSANFAPPWRRLAFDGAPQETFWRNIAELAPEVRVQSRKASMSGALSRPALVDKLVLAPVVDGSQYRAVTKLVPKFGHVGVKVVLIHLAEALLPKHGSNRLHLLGMAA